MSHLLLDKCDVVCSLTACCITERLPDDIALDHCNQMEQDPAVHLQPGLVESICKQFYKSTAGN